MVGDNFNMIVTEGVEDLLHDACELDRIEGNQKNMLYHCFYFLDYCSVNKKGKDASHCIIKMVYFNNTHTLRYKCEHTKIFQSLIESVHVRN